MGSFLGVSLEGSLGASIVFSYFFSRSKYLDIRILTFKKYLRYAPLTIGHRKRVYLNLRIFWSALKCIIGIIFIPWGIFSLRFCSILEGLKGFDFGFKGILWFLRSQGGLTGLRSDKDEMISRSRRTFKSFLHRVILLIKVKMVQRDKSNFIPFLRSSEIKLRLCHP